MKTLRLSLLILILTAAGCGEKKVEHLNFGVTASSEKSFVFDGGAQPCEREVDFGGLPNVLGYYYRVENAGFQWNSTDSILALQKLTMSLTIPGSFPHTCTFTGDQLKILFGLDSLVIGPATSEDTCGTGESAVTNCIEKQTVANGRCNVVCGSLPMSDGTANFIVPATLELSGVEIKDGDSHKVSRSTRVLVEYSK